MTFEQSVAWWCFDRADIDADDLFKTAKEIGYTAFELLPVDRFAQAVDYGFKIATHGAHRPLEVGMNALKNHDDILRQTHEHLELAVKWNIPNLICFSGNRNGIDDEQGAETTISILQKLAKDAESAGIMLILELLNSKVDHPDYQCDHTDWGVKVVQAVDSPKVKLLYDIYHMQVMEGDIIQTIKDNHQYFAHYHTAGVPGRHEIDESQELYYPPIMQAIADTGYTAYVGQEFVPVRDWKAGLQQAFELCNVG